MVAHTALLTDEKPFERRHSADLKSYYGLVDYGTFVDNLAKIINAAIERPAEDDDAKRIIGHLSDWSDGICQGEKELLLEAVNKRSSLALDLIHWICQVTEALVIASIAPAASDHDRDELIRNAKYLIFVLSWLPDDKESVAFVEGCQIIDQLFELALKMQVKDEPEIAEATRDILLRWSLKAGKHQTGWGSLERAITALCVLAAWKDGSGWLTWLKGAFADRVTGTVIEGNVRKLTAKGLRENANYPNNNRHVHGVVGYHMSRVDRGRFAEGMNAVADLLYHEVP